MTRPKAAPPAPPKKGGWPKGRPRPRKTPEERARCAPKRPSELRSTKTDWLAVRNSYVRGIAPPDGDPNGTRRFPPLVEVAALHGVGAKTVEVKSAEENWPEQRESYRRELQTREDSLLLERLAQQGARARAAYFGTALRGQQMIDRKLRQDEVSDVALGRLMAALRSSQQVADVAQGNPAEGPGAAGGGPTFWLQFIGEPPTQVRDALLTIDASAPPSIGVVAGPGRS